MRCPVCDGIRVSLVQVRGSRTLVRCAECRLLYDRAAAPVAASRTELSEAERLLEERVAQRRASQFARLLRAAGPPGRLLDVGAGVGELVRLAGEAGWQAVGVDVDAAVVAYARARGLDVRLGTLASLRLPASSVDLVTLCNALDFAHDPLAVLRECRRVLVPGGRVFVRTPNLPFQRAGAGLARVLATLALGRLVPDAPGWLGVFHTSNFGARALRVALARAGFEAITIGNSLPSRGDPYLGLGRLGERVLGAGKRGVFGAGQVVARASRGRWLLGSSIEAWARKPA